MRLFANRPDIFQQTWPTPENAATVAHLCARLQILRLRANQRLWHDKIAPVAPSGTAQALLDHFFGFPGVEDIVTGPEFSVWFAGLQDAYSTLSNDDIQGVLADFARFHIVLTLRSGQPADLTVRLDTEGDLYLPGTPIRLTFGRHLQGAQLNVHINEGPVVEDNSTLVRLLKDALCGANDRITITPPTHVGEPSNVDILPQSSGITIMDGTPLLTDTLKRVAGDSARIVGRNDPAPKDDIVAAFTELEQVSARFSSGVRAIVRWIVPFISDVVYSTSDSTLPGVVFVRLRAGDPLWNAELILHEAAHNWLVTLMRLDPLVSDTRQLYRSPWRKDLRPLRGILVGTHAFLLVTDYMLTKWKLHHDPTGPIAQRTVLEHTRAMHGLTTLECDGTWTPAGRACVASLRLYADKLTKELEVQKSASRLWEAPSIAHDWPCLLDD